MIFLKYSNYSVHQGQTTFKAKLFTYVNINVIVGRCVKIERRYINGVSTSSFETL